MSWQHVIALLAGGALCVVSAVVPGAQVLLPVGTMVVGGALGNAPGTITSMFAPKPAPPQK